MNRYMVVMEPLDKFYFGSVNCYEDKESSYILKSSNFPQQTTVLGCMMRLILTQDDKFQFKNKFSKIEIEHRKKLIGNTGFDIEYKEDNNFGMIDSISPVFVVDKEEMKKQGKTGTWTERIIPLPKNAKNDISEFKTHGLKKIDGVRNSNNEETYILDFDKTDYKKGLRSGFLKVDKNLEKSDILEFEDVFREIEDVGINRSSEVDGFYKRVSYKFKDGKYAFAFVMDTKFEFKDSIVQMGAKLSMFKARFYKMDNMGESIEKSLSIKNEGGYIAFLSDAYVEGDIVGLCKAAIIDTVSFKTVSLIAKGNVNFIDRTSKKTYNFIKRGSVLYFDKSKEEDIKKMIDTKYMKKIGYNYYI